MPPSPASDLLKGCYRSPPKAPTNDHETRSNKPARKGFLMKITAEAIIDLDTIPRPAAVPPDASVIAYKVTLMMEGSHDPSPRAIRMAWEWDEYPDQ